MKTPEPGMHAPNFRAQDQTGKTRSLSEFKGKNVVLFFYPGDDAPESAEEACGFRDEIDRFLQANTTIVGVATSSVERHEEFARRYSLPFTLLSDPEAEILQAYNAGDEAAHQVTYLIGPDGEVLRVYQKVDPARHAAQILEDLQGAPAQ